MILSPSEELLDAFILPEQQAAEPRQFAEATQANPAGRWAPSRLHFWVTIRTRAYGTTAVDW